MKSMILLLLVQAAAFAQGTYAVTRTSSLSGTTEAITVQLPTGTSRTVGFLDASVYCSAVCEFTVERDGTAATTTELTVAKVRSYYPAATATAYRSSNVGSGTTITAHTVPEGGTYPLPLREMGILAGGNVTIRVAAVTATVKINVMWQEY